MSVTLYLAIPCYTEAAVLPETARRLREKFWLAALMPVLFNGVIVGAVVHFCYSPAIALPLCMLSVAAGEAVACLVVGPLLIGVLRRVPASVLN